MYGCAAIVRGNSWLLNCYGKRGVLPAGSRKDTSFCHFLQQELCVQNYAHLFRRDVAEFGNFRFAAALRGKLQDFFCKLNSFFKAFLQALRTSFLQYLQFFFPCLHILHSHLFAGFEHADVFMNSEDFLTVRIQSGNVVRFLRIFQELCQLLADFLPVGSFGVKENPRCAVRKNTGSILDMRNMCSLVWTMWNTISS